MRRPRFTDEHTIRAAGEALHDNRQRRWGRFLPFLGPAFVASVAYIDPGNFATNIQAGALFGYQLLWVVLASNLMAMLIQALSAKLGIATGRNLAELCREHLPSWVVLPMWVIMELVAMATDLAEFVGAAVGFNLLFGIPLGVAGLVTAILTLAILRLERYGFRPFEIVISALVGIVGFIYLMETVLDRPAWGAVAHGALVPSFAGPQSILLATGILGATVMPHVIFLHSELAQARLVGSLREHRRMLFRFEALDVLIAMGMAGLINAAMLIMAASTFHARGLSEIGTLEQAHRTLMPLLGSASSWMFAVSLLAAGLSSASVGTMSGQVIMQGFLQRRIPIVVRRLVTIVPSVVVIAAGFEPTRALVVSQVVLSFGLPFAVVPLVAFTAQRSIMGDELVNRRSTTLVAGIVALLIVTLNAYLLYGMLTGT